MTWDDAARPAVECPVGDFFASAFTNKNIYAPVNSLAVCVNPISTKTALNLAGFEVGGLRLPLVDATPEETEKIRELLEQADVLEPAVRA